MALGIFGRSKVPRQSPWRDSDRDRPRVLIEHHGVAESEVVARILGEAGYVVATCEGPDASHGTACTMSKTGDCSLVDEADLVYHGLRVSDEVNREVLASIRRRYPDTPVIVEAAGPTLERYAEELEGFTTVAFPATSAGILRAVEAELGAAPAP
ncbi:MAG: hypothetical protein R3A49_00920 [Acidimicrobiia bacterium]